jgi:hypothetical protein
MMELPVREDANPTATHSDEVGQETESIAPALEGTVSSCQLTPPSVEDTITPFDDGLTRLLPTAIQSDEVGQDTLERLSIPDGRVPS